MISGVVVNIRRNSILEKVRRFSSLLIIEVYDKHPEKTYATKRSDVDYTKDTWSKNSLDLTDFGPKSKKNIDIF